MSTLLVLGGSGQVGRQIVAQALADPAVGCVVAPTRQPLAAHARLLNPLVDYRALPADASWWAADAVLCALGSTRRLAGSDAAFRQIDHDYVLIAAGLARHAGTPVFVYNSSVGADAAAGSLYLRVKGETERDLDALGFASVCHVRPSLLDGAARADARPGESAALWLARRLAPLLPRRYRAVRTGAVAAAMLRAALQPSPGVRIIESERIAA
ncbi:NAD-dependent dehydratase [Janthinobacterium fluminis]|uniref:NAD-dependent dehydratase n=1 Tax=Janthinobacterium fluminis TaxID=2987524 RepID=A0ABT5JWA0_9BURK|nr:NAD-dependent dehydratase [Janthinobacterium fluminis]MDC8756341.1 NAD-dependent dehydratase [Janthinobacterium fluminis]